MHRDVVPDSIASPFFNLTCLIIIGRPENDLMLTKSVPDSVTENAAVRVSTIVRMLQLLGHLRYSLLTARCRATNLDSGSELKCRLSIFMLCNIEMVHPLVHFFRLARLTRR